ncbi:MAG: hypothetical protein AAFY02_18045 [Pseudomonadota bacterium]
MLHLTGSLSPLGRIVVLVVLGAAFAAAWAFGLRQLDLIIEGAVLAAIALYVLAAPMPAPSPSGHLAPAPAPRRKPPGER